MLLAIKDGFVIAMYTVYEVDIVIRLGIVRLDDLPYNTVIATYPLTDLGYFVANPEDILLVATIL